MPEVSKRVLSELERSLLLEKATKLGYLIEEKGDEYGGGKVVTIRNPRDPDYYGWFQKLDNEYVYSERVGTSGRLSFETDEATESSGRSIREVAQAIRRASATLAGTMHIDPVKRYRFSPGPYASDVTINIHKWSNPTGYSWYIMDLGESKPFNTIEEAMRDGEKNAAKVSKVDRTSAMMAPEEITVQPGAEVPERFVAGDTFTVYAMALGANTSRPDKSFSNVDEARRYAKKLLESDQYEQVFIRKNPGNEHVNLKKFEAPPSGPGRREESAGKDGTTEPPSPRKKTDQEMESSPAEYLEDEVNQEVVDEMGYTGDDQGTSTSVPKTMTGISQRIRGA